MNANHTPLVSIVMPSYNSSRFIAESIEAIRRQTYTHWELLIVDDCSSDNTIDIVNSYVAQDSRIQLFQNSVNGGAAVSRNRATDEAKGEYIAFCDSDDCWDSCKLAVQVAFMQEHGCYLSYHNYRVINSHSEVMSSRVSIPSVTHKQMLRYNAIGCLTAMYNCQVLGKTHMTNLRRRQDWALWLTLLNKTPKALCIPQEMAAYRVGHNSVSSNKVKLIVSHYLLYRIHEQYSVVKSLYYLLKNIYYYITLPIKQR